MLLKNTLLILLCTIIYIHASAQNLANRLETFTYNYDILGGTLVVFCQNGLIESLSFGKSDLDRNIPTTEDTKYRIASISKTITSIAIMQLAERNLLDLDQDISDILRYKIRNPVWPEVAITVRMLLSHTSSITDDSTYNNFLDATVKNNPIPDLKERLTLAGSYYSSDQFLSTMPGSYFMYSNFNFIILGTIVEKISASRFDVYCKKFIIDPLNINASFNVNDLRNMDEVSVLYRKINGAWIAQTDDYKGIQPTYNKLKNYVPGTNGGRFGPQGGLRCSGKDLAKIFLVLMNNGTFENTTLLTPKSCNDMCSNQWTFNGSNGDNYSGLFRSWGLGIHRITSTLLNDIVLPGSSSMLGHSGDAYGLISDAYFDKKRNVGFVFIANGIGKGYQNNESSAFYTIEQEIFNIVEEYGKIEDCLNSAK